MTSLFAFFEGAMSPTHLMVVLIIGILVFGKRLPEIGRTLGKGIQEFKKGFNGEEDNLGPEPPARAPQLTEAIRPPQRVTPQAPAAPKFEDHEAPVTPPAMV
jgi:sec-independent protein translocase protein TatA